jgi:hypothetical protein
MDITTAQEELRIIAKSLGVTSIARSEKDNTLIVTIGTDFEQNRFLLLQNIKLDNIIIINDNTDLHVTSTVNYVINGNQTVINNFELTVGFAAKDSSGDAGFVTAGHINANDDDDVYYNGSHCGDVDGSQNSGSVDATFVDLRYPFLGTKWLPTKEFMNGNTYYSVNTSDYFLIQGVGIYAYEDVSGKEFGTLLSTSYDFLDENNNLRTDFVQANYVAIPGDSGAAVTMTGYWGGSTFHVKVIGVQSHSWLNQDLEWVPGQSWVAFSEAGNIFSILNLSNY